MSQSPPPARTPAGPSQSAAGGGLRSRRTTGSRLSRVLHWLGWPIRMLLQGLILGYQRFISPYFGNSCRYYPSCSGYALVAIRRHGAFKGTILATWRILKCNPWSGGGIDRVPRRGRWRSAVAPDGSSRDKTNAASGDSPRQEPQKP